VINSNNWSDNNIRVREMNFMSKVIRNKVYNSVVEKIIKKMQDENLKVGDKFPTERELSEEYGVSRSSIREGLSVLESAGYIEVKPRSGIRILANPTEQIYNSLTKSIDTNVSPIDLLEVRMGIECNAAYFAAQRKTFEDIRNIEESYKKLESQNEKLEYDVDFQFHHSIAVASHNILLVQVFDAFLTEYRKQLQERYGWATKIYGNNSPSLGEHYSIMQAIREGDGAKSEQAMRRHLSNSQTRLNLALEFKNNMKEGEHI
jgi:GntR family transcriptional repressor for pyruvate dehydrogenase complex